MHPDKKPIALNIKKTLGTLNKIIQMIDDDVYCADIAQQINASIGLLRSANTQLLKSHLACCGTKTLSSGNPQEIKEFVEEFARVWDMSVRK